MSTPGGLKGNVPDRVGQKALLLHLSVQARGQAGQEEQQGVVDRQVTQLME
jgi:hypothetical protein